MLIKALGPIPETRLTVVIRASTPLERPIDAPGSAEQHVGRMSGAPVG